MRAWSYVRVSTDEQITGDGLNRQNRLYLDACALYGWEPAEHQVVDALSGFSDLGMVLHLLPSILISSTVAQMVRFGEHQPYHTSCGLNQLLGCLLMVMGKNGKTTTRR